MPTGKQNSWAQAAGKGLTASTSEASYSSVFENELSSNSSSKVMKMAENASESLMAAALSEGWGQRGVNQDTAWDVPSSPQCSPKEGSSCSGSTSTGTEVWKSSIHQQGKNFPGNNSGHLREPWGRSMSVHIGGTWGEEEDAPNLFPGVPQARSTPWAGDSSTSVWGANTSEGENWSSQNSTANFSTWGNDAPLPIGLTHLPLLKEAKNTNDNGPDVGAGVWADPSHKRTFANWSPMTGVSKKTVQSFGWDESASAPASCQSGGGFDDGTSVWGNPGHQRKVCHWKEMPPNKQMPNCILPPANICGTGNSCAGPAMMPMAPAAANLNKTENSWMKTPGMNRGLSWNDMPNHCDTSGRHIWDDFHNHLQDKNVPSTSNAPNSAFGSWPDPSLAGGAYWSNNKSKNPLGGLPDGQVDTAAWGDALKQGNKPLSKDLIWSSKQFRLLAEMNFKNDDIENALRYNNMNFEDALLHLHSLNNKENNPIELDVAHNLNQNRLPHPNIEDLNFSDQYLDNHMGNSNIYGSNNYPGMAVFSGFGIGQSCKNQMPVGNNASMLGNGATNSQVQNLNLSNGLNSMSPAMMRKIAQQNQTFNPAGLPPNALGNQTGRINQPHTFPSTAQLRHLVQQIQMAVQAGHLNPQILNQPLAPQTLQLLYQLLQQIRILHQFQQQQMFCTQHGIKHCNPPLQLSVQITQTKQLLVNLQNQIAAQQAVFLKQHNIHLPVQHPSLQTPQPSTFDNVKPNLDAINDLNMEFRDLSIKDSSAQNHSHLNQWKLPELEKQDGLLGGDSAGCVGDISSSSCSISEFSRAPGSVAKSSPVNSLPACTAQHSGPILQPLNENTWSDLPPHCPQSSWATDSGEGAGSAVPGDNSLTSAASDNVGSISCDRASNKGNSASEKEPSIPSTCSTSQCSYNLNDLVPEFEPGKPWKGSLRNKNFEDDPNITPGSVAKSPLSLSTIKDSDLFIWNNKSSQVSSSPSSSLTTSTWSFSPPLPPSSNQSSVPLDKSVISKPWGARTDANARWKDVNLPKTRGPPPGLASQGKNLSSNWMYGENPSQNWSANSD